MSAGRKTLDMQKTNSLTIDLQEEEEEELHDC
jgi:hypothetical protein